MNTMLWIDKYLSQVLTLLLSVLFFSAILFLGIVSIPGIYAELFEYKVSLWDLSYTEIGFLLLFAVLIYRHVSCCIKYKIGIWTSITRPFYSLGYLMLISLALVGLIEMSAIYSEELGQAISPREILVGPNGVEQLMGFTATLMAIYLATPSSNQILSK